MRLVCKISPAPYSDCLQKALHERLFDYQNWIPKHL